MSFGDSSAAPSYTLAQIIRQLQTQWGGSEEGIARKWTGSNVTYSMPDLAPTNMTAYFGPPTEASGLVVMQAGMKSAAREAFELWDDLIAISLTESTGNRNAQITFNYSSKTEDDGSYARPAYNMTTPARDMLAQQIWLSSKWDSHDQASDLGYGGYGFQIYLHEIGHTLGLSHPGTYNAAPGVNITYASHAEFAQDNRQFTVMSYFGSYNATTKAWTQDGTPSNNLYSSTPMLYDVAAIQALYGADMTTRTGDTVYGFNSNAGRAVFNFQQNTSPILTIWDAGGVDTLDTSGYTQNQTINLTAGTYSNVGGMVGNIAIAFGATIENATGGSGADTIHGNEVGNLLLGNAGADTLNGNSGNDTLNGGAGSDRLDGGAGDDVIFYDPTDTQTNITGGAGYDTLVFTSGAVPTAFALAARGFEAGQGRFTDTGNQAWATRTDTYDQLWRITRTELVNDNGTSQTTDIDAANSQQWTRIDTYRLADGRTNAQNVRNDNGTSEGTQWDHVNAEAWSIVNTAYDAAGRTGRQSVVNDDNTARTTHFDADNSLGQSWSRIDTYYDTAGRNTIQSTSNDDGTVRAMYWDQAGSQSWSVADTYYDTQGQTTLQSVLEDNGTVRTQYWDTTSTNPWSSVVHFYDQNGNRTLTTGFLDDGTFFSY